jgi:DNA-directed RNA polymerase specialized sigma54-like protein
MQNSKARQQVRGNKSFFRQLSIRISRKFQDLRIKFVIVIDKIRNIILRINIEDARPGLCIMNHNVLWLDIFIYERSRAIMETKIQDSIYFAHFLDKKYKHS